MRFVIHWQNAMRDEYAALIKNNTRTLVPRPTDTNIICSMRLFRHKYHSDGTLSHYKACLVANGSTQLKGVDVDETFSPVVKLGTIHTVLSLASSRHWPVHQFDVKSAFLHGDISETVYIHQPLGMLLSQKKYVVEILERAGMVNCNPSQTPIDTKSKLDISYAVQQIEMVVHYSEIDFSAEAEYRGVVNVVAETCWLHNFMRDSYSCQEKKNKEIDVELCTGCHLLMFMFIFDKVFSTWMTFGGNTRDLGSFGEETDEITDLHQDSPRSIAYRPWRWRHRHKAMPS
ncbi:ribonuclease H-like domain-containing protein [Tanacetum coccineum]